MSENIINTAGIVRTTWRDRLRWRLFPGGIPELPEAPAAYRDVLHCDTECYFGWRDRLRILVSGRVMVMTRTVTENMIGGCVTASIANVLAPRFMRRRQRSE